MKTTATLIQQVLEQEATDSMITYGWDLISEQKMEKTLNDALRHYNNVEGYRSVVFKGWIIKTIYTLRNNQLDDLGRIALKYIKSEY